MHADDDEGEGEGWGGGGVDPLQQQPPQEEEEGLPVRPYNTIPPSDGDAVEDLDMVNNDQDLGMGVGVGGVEMDDWDEDLCFVDSWSSYVDSTPNGSSPRNDGKPRHVMSYHVMSCHFMSRYVS